MKKNGQGTRESEAWAWTTTACAFIAVVASLIWLVKEPGFEALLAFFGSLIVTLTYFGLRNSYKQKVVDQIVAAILLLAATFIVIFLTGNTPKPTIGKMKDCQFCIAVAGFASPEDSRQNLELGQIIGNSIRLSLENNIRAEPEVTPAGANSVGTFQGRTIDVWGPDEIGNVQGATAEDRAANAARLAEEIDADIIIYGFINSLAESSSIQTEFYIANKKSYLVPGLASTFGKPFFVPSETDASLKIRVGDEVAPRTWLFLKTILGLIYYAIANEDALIETKQKYYENSLTTLLQVAEDEKWEVIGGQEVLLMLMGNVALQLENFDLAETYFQEALQVDSEYARAHLGLANIFYRRALLPGQEQEDPQAIDAELINLALAELEKAEFAKNQPVLADVSTKIHFERGENYLALAYSGNMNSYERAIIEFQQVIDDYDDGKNERVRSFASESHARLGAIYRLTDQLTLALEEYQTAFSLAEDNERRGIFEQIVEDLQWQDTQ